MPAWFMVCGGKVIIELRLNGTMAVRFGNRYLNCHEIMARSAPTTKQDEASLQEASSPGMTPTNGRSGRTPAEPYPPADEEQGKKQGPYRPAANHPWRGKFPAKKGER
jgi:hypothetical protein